MTLNLKESRATVADTLKVSGPFTEQTTVTSESPSLTSSPEPSGSRAGAGSPMELTPAGKHSVLAMGGLGAPSESWRPTLVAAEPGAPPFEEPPLAPAEPALEPPEPPSPKPSSSSSPSEQAAEASAVTRAARRGDQRNSMPLTLHPLPAEPPGRRATLRRTTLGSTRSGRTRGRDQQLDQCVS